MNYNEEYYKTNNYTNYTERKDRYVHLARELDNLFRMIGISKDKTIIDYGCALGYLIDGFTELGYNITGYEISEYCIKECKKRGIILTDELKSFYDIIIGLDVFEHMTDKHLDDLFKTVQSEFLIARIPVCDPNTKEFVLDCSKLDPSHINKKTKFQWRNKFEYYGYRRFFPLNMYSIYDSAGVYSFLACK